MSVDLLILIVCAVLIGLWAYAFPYPSVLIRWLLPPKKRWPEAQIRAWLEKGRFDKAYLTFFYRDPERTVPNEEGLVAPADGLVTSLDCRDGIRYIVIALNLWDVHVQRCPEDASVVKIERLGSDYMDGEGRSFAFLRAKPCPVQLRISMNTPVGPIAVRLITSLAARRLQSFAEEGDFLRRGQRLGKILLGSTVVLELPEAWPVSIRRGDRVTAGETLISNAGG